MIDVVENPGQKSFSPAKAIGAIMADYMSAHDDFYLFSPDETTSNKLDDVFDVSSRAWILPTEDYDLPESGDGRIIEMLSENALFACMVGHLVSGGKAAMTSYEAFFMIIASQLLQHLKFLQQSSEVSWRPNYPAVNLLSTSTCWRQDHNGFTHQSPALISTLLSLPSQRTNCLFPIDDVSAETAFIYMMNSTNVVNLTTFNKTDQPRWLDSHQADAQLKNGGVLNFDSIFTPVTETKASEPDEVSVTIRPSVSAKRPAPVKAPDYVLAGVGDIVSNETLRALEILRKDLPDRIFRFVNISALSYNQIGTTDSPLSQPDFDDIFTARCPIIANFHGYPETLRQILTHYADPTRLYVHGYEEQGSTTTPFEMLSINRASRYHLAIDVARLEKRDDLVQKYQKILEDNRIYAHEHGTDQVKV